MSSYNSLTGSIKRHFPGADEDRTGGSAAASPALRPTERTPLLSIPENTYLSAVSDVIVEQHPVTPDDETEVIDFEEDASMPVLSKMLSNAALGIEAEAIPPLANTPDEYGDFRLPKDEGLRLQITPIEDPEAGSQCSFHGGISRKSFWLIFAGILISNFVTAFDSTIMASTHTSITSSFNASNSAAWLSTSFLLTCTSFQPLFGRVSDVMGRKIPFVFSCFVFTVATAWCGLAGSIGSFIAARAICGLGAGGMLTMASIILSDLLPIEIRGTYQSISNMVYGTGSALGAATGGLLADMLGWRWEFGIQVPFGLFCMVVCMITIPNSEKLGQAVEKNVWTKFRNFDFAGSFFLTTSVGFLILGMNLGGNVYPWSSWPVLSSLALGFILGNLLLRTEKKAQSPVMPLEFLISSPRGNLIFSNFLVMVSINAIIFNIPIFFQTVLLESATKAGSRLLIPTLSGTAASVATGLIITRTGHLKPTLYAGCFFLIIGSILFCFMERNFSSWVFFLFLVPCNLGSGFALPSTLMSVLATSSQAEQAVATSTLILWRSLGCVMGVAGGSLVVQNCLLYFLKKNVTGPEKEHIISMVRSSVNSVYDLSGVHLEEVIQSYATSLKYCFIFTTIVSVLAVLLVVRIRLPSLKTREQYERLKTEIMAEA